MKRVLLLAGEESGEIYAQGLRHELRHTFADVEIRGYGDYGFEIGDLAVFGIWPVLKKIFYFLRVKRTMQGAIDTWRPDVVCTIDYPGMNLKLAAYAKRRGIRAVHVVCPQVWAWHQGRVPRIEAALDRLCCFFPFEPQLFRPGFATFVGHPLVEHFACSQGTREARVLALLPGSRVGEIRHHLPTLLAAAHALHEKLPDLRVEIPAANAKARCEIERLAADCDVRPHIQTGGARELLARARCAAIASGTATLEAALAGCPTVLVYRVGWLLGKILRHVITGTRFAGLANVIWERCSNRTTPQPMPELLQEDFTATRVAATLMPWLTDAHAHAAAQKALTETTCLLKVEGNNALARIVTELNQSTSGE